MCYPIQISTQVLDPESSDSTASDFRMPGSDFILTDSPFGTICCLTEEGLVRWESILGEIKYNAWLQQNGCSTAYYTIQQASILFNEGNELAIDNNGFNYLIVIWFFYEIQSLNAVKTFTNSQFRALSVVIFDRNLANALGARRSLGIGVWAHPAPSRGGRRRSKRTK